MSSIYVLGLGDSGLSVLRHCQRWQLPVELFDTRMQPPGLAKVKQQYPEVKLHLGPWVAETLAKAAQIVISPGLNPHDPALNLARQAGVPIIGDIEWFVQQAKAPIIAITGTNAKGTVTTWLAEMIQAAGKRVLVGGNIGIPALDLLVEATPDYYVLELSSFQLESTYSLAAHAAVVLNLSEDHLDRHGSMSHYLSAKQRIYHNAQHAIVNRDQIDTWPSPLPKRVYSFGCDAPKGPHELGLRQVDGLCYLAYGNDNILAIDQLKVKGSHNALNALAALALGLAIGLPMEAMAQALTTFTGLEHRCQFVACHQHITWYNDSKATNVGATLAALEGFSQQRGQIVLIAGGQAKGQDFSPLIDAVHRTCRAVIILGIDGPQLAHVLQGQVPLIRVTDLAEAVHQAAQIAQAGDHVLLSPACASLDMFNNYEDRGHQFVALVKGCIAAAELIAKQAA